MWLHENAMTDKLRPLAEQFVKQYPAVLKSDSCHGECDIYAVKFLNLAKKHGIPGILRCIGTPTREPDLGWKFWGSSDLISHYVADFGNVIVDWTARQFWKDAPVPMILTKKEMQQLWSDPGFDEDQRLIDPDLDFDD